MHEQGSVLAWAACSVSQMWCCQTSSHSSCLLKWATLQLCWKNSHGIPLDFWELLQASVGANSLFTIWLQCSYCLWIGRWSDRWTVKKPRHFRHRLQALTWPCVTFQLPPEVQVPRLHHGEEWSLFHRVCKRIKWSWKCRKKIGTSLNKRQHWLKEYREISCMVCRVFWRMKNSLEPQSKQWGKAMND